MTEIKELYGTANAMSLQSFVELAFFRGLYGPSWEGFGEARFGMQLSGERPAANRLGLNEMM
jgi:hypothetical protein